MPALARNPGKRVIASNCSKQQSFLAQAVIPVNVPGTPPLAIALLGGPRSDMQLLHIAGKLAPQIQRSATEIASRGPAKQPQPPQQQASRAAATRRLQTMLLVLLYRDHAGTSAALWS